MEVNATFWIGFTAFVLLMLALDLGVFHKKAHAVSIKEALTWSGIWIALAFSFNGLIYHWFGEAKAVEFFTGYVIEKSLSVDNLFVFVIIFGYFNIAPKYQHKILFWGILGALVMRVIFIFVGVTLIEKFHWTIYVFGAFLLYTGFKMFSSKEETFDPSKSGIVKWFKKLIPLSPEDHNGKFLVKKEGKTYATILLLVLLLVEFTDLIFAVDSIPAILAISQDHFIVYTSNVFAILGLRSLYFALAHVVHKFTYLSYGLALILMFIGTKMLLIDVFKIPTFISLLIIAFIITISIIFSLLKEKEKEKVA